MTTSRTGRTELGSYVEPITMVSSSSTVLLGVSVSERGTPRSVIGTIGALGSS